MLKPIWKPTIWYPLACICQEAKTLADRQHKRAQAEHLLHATQSWEAAGSIELAARDSLALSPTGASLRCCDSPAIPSRKGARRSCRNCVLGLVRKLWPFVCSSNSQEGGQGRKLWPEQSNLVSISTSMSSNNVCLTPVFFLTWQMPQTSSRCSLSFSFNLVIAFLCPSSMLQVGSITFSLKNNQMKIKDGQQTTVSAYL